MLKTQPAFQQQAPLRDTGASTINSQISLRDALAIASLQSMPAPMTVDDDTPPTEEEMRVVANVMKLRAQLAYMQADAMLIERAKAMQYKKQKRKPIEDENV